jgi:hypothetical protein
MSAQDNEDASTSTQKKILTRVFYTKYFLALAFLVYLLYTLHHTTIHA